MCPWARLLACLLTTCVGSGLGGCGGGAAGANGPPSDTGGQAAAPAAETQAPPGETPSAGQPTTIRVLALKTAEVAEQFPQPDVRIAHLLNVANETLAASAVNLTFELADVMTVDYPAGLPITTALNELTNGTGALGNVSAWRDARQADLVVLFRAYANDGLCGFAWIGGYLTGGDLSNPSEADFGYSVVAVDCSDYILLHELGHNLGLAHSRREAPEGGSFPYGAGHGVDNDFVTIMASPTEFNALQLPLMASPALDCNGSPCGISASDPVNGADAVTAVNAVVEQVARYR